MPGLKMEVIGFVVSDVFSDLVLPVVCAFASGMVIVRGSPEYVSSGNPARIDWLCDLQRQGCLGLVHSATC